MEIRKAIILLFLFLSLYLFVLPVQAEEEENFFTVYDEEDRVIFYTGEYVLSLGDRYINQKNQEYLIYQVDEEKREARARGLGPVDLFPQAREEGLLSITGPLFTNGEKKIAIYHTHTEESFVPTSGTHDKPGEGDIFEVGVSFKEELERMGVEVLHDLTRHEPRDAASYDRSKPTAKKLMEEGPDAIFDIHRDGVPNREEYTTIIDGEEVSMVRFVVGRQNPNMSIIEDFAKGLKAAADTIEPGLVKGILFANGKYNQELSSHALLLEIGTHLNSLEEAQKGGALMANVVGEYFYSETAPRGRESIAQQRSALLTLFYLILFVALGGFFFLYINAGSWEETFQRLKEKIGHGVLYLKNRRDKGER